MSIPVLGGRPEEQFKLAIGFLMGSVIAVPVNVLLLTNWQYSSPFSYLLIAIFLGAIVFHKRAFVLGTSASILLISLPQVLAAMLPTPMTNWHLSAAILWLLALAILGCLYLMREAETRTNADIDVYWLFRSQK